MTTDSNAPSTKRPLIFLAVLALATVAGLYFMNRGGSGPQTLPDGLKKVSEFTLKKADGSDFGTEQMKDHVVVVHFWASWCAPCIPEIPEVLSAAKKLSKDQEGRTIYWLFVSQDETWAKAQSVLKPEMLSENVISVLDPEAKISDIFGSYQFPETYLVNRDGGITAKWIGPQKWREAWGDQAIAGVESLSRLKKLPDL